MCLFGTHGAGVLTGAARHIGAPMATGRYQLEDELARARAHVERLEGALRAQNLEVSVDVVGSVYTPRRSLGTGDGGSPQSVGSAACVDEADCAAGPPVRASSPLAMREPTPRLSNGQAAMANAAKGGQAGGDAVTRDAGRNGLRSRAGSLGRSSDNVSASRSGQLYQVPRLNMRLPRSNSRTSARCPSPSRCLCGSHCTSISHCPLVCVCGGAVCAHRLSGFASGSIGCRPAEHAAQRCSAVCDVSRVT